MGDRNAGLQRIGKGDALEIAAARFHHEADDGALGDGEQAALDEPAVHGAIEIRVVMHVVHVAVGVVVHPAGGDGTKQAKGGAVGARGTIGHGVRHQAAS